MSFRDLRNFTEMMKSLGYRRLISVENFRSPNFELVADVLFWLVHRYDPNATLSDDISTEDARVEFLSSVAQIMMVKARVKLSIKQLYRADGYAVKELIKVASLLYDADKVEADQALKLSDVAVGNKLEGARDARALASEIVESGSKLYDMLGREGELKPERDRALRFLDSLTSNLDSDEAQRVVDRSIREQIQAVAENASSLERRVADLQGDHAALHAKIEKKTVELERAEKRLSSLRKVRPAFQEEYERLEAELRQLHDVYVERYRNAHYLESELARFRAAEESMRRQSDRALKRMQRRLREAELRQLHGEDMAFEMAGKMGGRAARRSARPGGADLRKRENAAAAAAANFSGTGGDSAARLVEGFVEGTDVPDGRHTRYAPRGDGPDGYDAGDGGGGDEFGGAGAVGSEGQGPNESRWNDPDDEDEVGDEEEDDDDEEEDEEDDDDLDNDDDDGQGGSDDSDFF